MGTYTVTDAIIAKTRRFLDSNYFSENKANVQAVESATETLDTSMLAVQTAIETIEGDIVSIQSAVETLDTSKMAYTGANAALPVYADNAAALTAEAPVGSLYATPAGAVFVVLAA